MKKIITVLFLTLVQAVAVLAQPAAPADLNGTALQEWLKANYFDGHHVTLSYTDARVKMYNYIDNKSNTLTCVYSGYEMSWAYGGSGSNPSPINCEHTVPQSFFGSASPMVSDIHHLFPTYGNWNSTRSNYPFKDISDVSTEKWMFEATSQTSIPASNIDAYSEYANSSFEPREDHKGNLARAIFYFYTMYPTQAGSITAVADPALLYQWHLADPIDGDEILRNNLIETYQGDRNPYIDYPELVGRAWGFSGAPTNTPPAAPAGMSLVAAVDQISLDWNDVSGETGYNLYKSIDNSNFSLITTLNANTTSYVDNGVTQGQTYYYYVVAFNAYGNSPASTTVTGTPTSTGGGGGSATASELIISEYVEGASYDKVIEIANFTGSAVSLSGYSLAKQTNGAGAWEYLSLSGTLNHGDVYVVANSLASATIKAVADLTTTSTVMSFNGNDPVALFKSGNLIDAVGTFNGGSANFAIDATLVRIPLVNSPNSTYTAAEWQRYASGTNSYLGSHTMDLGGGPLPGPCDQTNGLTASNVTTSTATLSWNPAVGAASYEVRYKETASSTWITTTATGTSIGIGGLNEGTAYEFQVNTVCDEISSSGFTASATFNTAIAPCNQTSGLSASNVTTNSATLSWNAVSGAASYQVRYRQQGASSWTTVSATAASLNVSGFAEGTAYEFQVATVCASSTSAFTASATFTTATAPVVVTYCNSYGGSTADEWLNRVVFANINNTSGNNGGYGNFTALTANVNAGSAYTLTLYPAWSGRTYNEAYDVWIDFNQDGDFNDATELVYTRVRSKSTSVSGTVVIPASAKTGKTRMRISMKYNANSLPCEVFSYGEVEDYTINISGGVARMGEGLAFKPAVREANPAIEGIIYPNPASEVANLAFEAEGSAEIAIYGMDGRMVWNQTVEGDGRMVEVAIDVTSLQTGLYIVHVNTAQGKGTYRLSVK